jgi:hypothetical protein
VAQNDERITRKEIGITIPAEKMRYVKIVAKPAFDVIPSWHLGAGGKPWIFVDEVVVR